MTSSDMVDKTDVEQMLMLEGLLLVITRTENKTKKWERLFS